MTTTPTTLSVIFVGIGFVPPQKSAAPQKALLVT
jgi:hypothetical protein